MKRLGKIGRFGRLAIVAGLSAGFVLLAIPVANAASTDKEPVKIVRHQPAEPEIGVLVDWT